MIGLIFSSDWELGIGKNNDIPWHNEESLRKEDLSWFKSQTTGHTVIMGRRTWDSIHHRPLKDRRNIIISKRPVFIVGVTFCISPEVALKLCNDNNKYFVIGGASLYNHFLKHNYVDFIVWSRLRNEWTEKCDTFVDPVLFNGFVERCDRDVVNGENFTNFIYTLKK